MAAIIIHGCWNTDEYNPSGSYGNDKLGVIWHDHTGMFIAFSSLEFDDSNDFIIPSGIATTPNEIEMAISSTGFIDEVVIENIGQVEVFGELRCSENLAIQLSEFRLQPGESVTFWVHFTSELGGKYVEEISVLSTAGDFSIPVNIQYDAEINVDLIENLGSEKILYSRLNGTEIRIKSTKNIKDKNITIYLPKNKLYLFDNDKNRIQT